MYFGRCFFLLPFLPWPAWSFTSGPPVYPVWSLCHSVSSWQGRDAQRALCFPIHPLGGSTTWGVIVSCQRHSGSFPNTVSMPAHARTFAHARDVTMLCNCGGNDGSAGTPIFRNAGEATHGVPLSDTVPTREGKTVGGSQAPAHHWGNSLMVCVSPYKGMEHFRDPALILNVPSRWPHTWCADWGLVRLPSYLY